MNSDLIALTFYGIMLLIAAWCWGYNYKEGRAQKELRKTHDEHSEDLKKLRKTHREEIIRLKLKPGNQLLKDLVEGEMFRFHDDVYQLLEKENNDSWVKVIHFQESHGYLEFDSFTKLEADSIVSPSQFKFIEVKSS